MGAQATKNGRALIAFGEQRTAITIRAQRFGREEAGRRRVGLRAKRLAMQGPAETLREVIQREQPLAPGNRRQGGPVSRLPEQIHADKGARLQLAIGPDLRNALFQMCGVDLERTGIDVDEDRSGAKHQRHLGGRGVGKGREKHGIAAPDIFRHQRDLDRIGAGTDANAMLRAAEFRELRFQFGHFRPQNELAMRQHRIQPAAQVGGDTGLLCFQVKERNGGTCCIGHEASLDAELTRGPRLRHRPRCVRTRGSTGPAGPAPAAPGRRGTPPRSHPAPCRRWPGPPCGGMP